MTITGVYETYDGLPDFNNFDDYLKYWIRPNLLQDLETVFEGARERWEGERHNPGEPGRGDFIMATSLLSVFDHLGAFLARPVIEWITPAENIARIAKRLKPSLSGIFAIVANMGRNALTHGGWPQTAIVLNTASAVVAQVNDLAFGLSFNANSDPRRHDTFHWKPYKHRPLAGIVEPHELPQKTIKLVLNVHNLRQLLVRAIEEGNIFSKVTKEQFDRVKDIAILMGDSRAEARAALKVRAKPRPIDEAARKKHARNNLCKEETMLSQIERLLVEAKRLEVLAAREDEKVPRDYMLNRPEK